MCSSPRSGTSTASTDGRHQRLIKNLSKLSSTKPGELRDDTTSFKRCLELLGAPYHEQSTRKIGRNPEYASIRNARATPTVCTRLMKRTVSMSEICNSTCQPKEQIGRDVIVKAIYEEWYFRKLRNAHQLKLQKETEELEKQTKLQKEAFEKQRKAQENFIKWKHSKTKIQEDSRQQKISKNYPRDKQTAEVKVPYNKERAAEAFQSWKKEKDEILWKRKKAADDSHKKEEEKQQLLKEKKADAEAAFQIWKTRVDKVLRLQTQKENQMKKKMDAQKERQLKEKREESRSSFICWNNMKTAQIKKKVAEERCARERAHAAKVAMQEARLSECDLAFEEWLSHVEARESRRMQNSRHVTAAWIPC